MAEREYYNEDSGNFELRYDPGIYNPPAQTDLASPSSPAATDPNAWLYDPNADPSGFPGLPNGWQWVWNGNQWTSNHNAGGPSGPVSAPPPPSVGDGYSGGGGGGGGWGYLTEPFTGQAPQWRSGPRLDIPSLAAPPPFSYKEFQAPDKNSVYADPSYQFRKGEGEQALAQRAASLGKYRTGGTMKDFINYNQNAASQEYGNIFGRAVDAHNLGLTQALGTYGTNWGVTRDVNDALFREHQAEFEPLQRDNEQWNQREFDNFLASYDIFDRDRRRAGDYLFQGAELGNG
jgi:hypothetical protein